MDIKFRSGATDTEKNIARVNANELMHLLKKLNYSDSAVSAIMGNFGVETKYSYDYKQKQDDGGPGYGLFQMERGRGKNKGKGMLDAYEGWLTKNKKVDSAESQILYFNALVEGNDKSNPKYPGDSHIGFERARILKQMLHSKESITKKIQSIQDNLEEASTPHMKDRIETAEVFNEVQKYRKISGDLGETKIDFPIGGEAGDAAPQFKKSIPKTKTKRFKPGTKGGEFISTMITKDEVNNNFSEKHIQDITSADIVSSGIDSSIQQSFTKEQITNSFADNEYYENFFEKESI